MLTQSRIKLLAVLFPLMFISNSQKPDSFDTLYLRCGEVMLTPTYDAVKQIKIAEEKVDTLLVDLEMIKCKLGI
jgi:hypothetical protein